VGTGTFGYVVGDGADPGADIQNTIVLRDSLNEKIVITNQTMLGMNPGVVTDRRAIDLRIYEIGDLKQATECLGGFGLLSDGDQPGLEDAKHPVVSDPPRDL
jgi:hypothetical protein